MMQKINKSGHINWTRAIMIFSQLLLTAFVAQWIYSQYNDEKETLKKELSNLFYISQQEAIDTIILNIFDPLMGNDTDSSFYHIQLDFGDDTIITGTSTTCRNNLKIEKEISIDSLKTSFFSSTTSYKHKQIHVISETSTPEFSDEDLFVQGVNLLIQMTNDTSGTTNTILTLADTSLLKETFDKKLLDLNWNFKTAWTIGQVNDSTAISFNSSFLDSSFGVTIENYRLYLYKEIIPQMLFGLVLLLITGLAFLFTFKKLKDQITLNVIRKGFISNISHELKSPVATVKVALEALQKYDMSLDPEKTREYLEMAGHEMNRLDLLVSQVMSTSLMDEGKHPFNPQKEDLKQLISHVLKTMELRFQQRIAKVDFIADDDKYIFNFDKLLINGVIINLLDNSLKYTNKDPEIKIVLKHDKSNIILNITDNGIGIPEEFQNKIFEKFFRVPTGNMHNVKGYGLGLSYAKQVIDLHKADITVKNIATGGCSFIIRFPGQ